jgi:hypothetical protein
MLLVDRGMKKPPRSASLWRYLDFTKFVSLLDLKSLFFSRLDKLQDKYEGVEPKKQREKTLAWYKAFPMSEEDRASLLNNKFTMRNKIYVNCWHANRHESQAMWKVYLKSNEGVAIRTSFASLDAALKGTPHLVFAGMVDYFDYDAIESLQSQFMSKRASFAYEREFRLMYMDALPTLRKGKGVRTEWH